MAAYRRVYGFGHLRADFRGPGSAPELYAHFEYATTFTFTQTSAATPGSSESSHVFSKWNV